MWSIILWNSADTTLKATSLKFFGNLQEIFQELSEQK